MAISEHHDVNGASTARWTALSFGILFLLMLSLFAVADVEQPPPSSAMTGQGVAGD
jgi:hypothetical protein